jgi:hypothetical protein
MIKSRHLPASFEPVTARRYANVFANLWATKQHPVNGVSEPNWRLEVVLEAGFIRRSFVARRFIAGRTCREMAQPVAGLII